MGCLYRLISPSGKEYIGITLKSINERWIGHCKPLGAKAKILQNAIEKYGADSFTKQILVISNSWEYLCDLERKAIRCYGTFAPQGYNMTRGGDGVVSLCEEAKAKHRVNTSIGTSAAWQREEYRRSRAAALARPDVREKHREATRIGTKLAYSDGSLSRKLKLLHANPEYRAVVSNSVRELWTKPDYREKQLAKRRARLPRNEESKKRQGDRMRALIAERKLKGTYWL